VTGGWREGKEHGPVPKRRRRPNWAENAPGRSCQACPFTFTSSVVPSPDDYHSGTGGYVSDQMLMLIAFRVDTAADSFNLDSHRAAHPRGDHKVRATCFWPFSSCHHTHTRGVHLFSIRNRLTALKRDRGEYIKASDVTQLYHAIVKQGACRTRSYHR
jgi:hypothetical protein